ncbi:hypothetical protein C1645_731224 [Glomus cerebriforme]|uniref:C2H2-type domain-containing protein n=1 Tax=Glomus cerebriforme TaxID=658196 RepID=A0A397TQZ1_9GLOM|nr:hypothetical protein C1645_731224 [Glomus cerebriforme]
MKKKLDLNNLDLNCTYTDEELDIISKNLTVHTNFENGRLIPIPQNPIVKEAIIQEISRQLGNWNIQTGQNGIITTSQGGFNFGPSNRQKNILAPDIAFTPEETYIELDEDQLWSFDGQCFTPEFVVVVAVVTSDEILKEIDNRMNNYFGVGTSVKLGWLIDPKNSIICVYEKNGENRLVRRKCEWEDLDGGDILPDFILDISRIDSIMLLDNDVDEDDNERECPYCDFSFDNVHSMMKHLKKWHLDD